MAEIIITKSIGKNFVKTNGVLLQETADTALVFFPEIHPGGVRGHLVRFKKARDETWEKIPEKNFKQLQLYEGVHIELRTQQLQTLIDETNKRKLIAKDGIQYGQTEYVVGDKNNVLLIDNKNIKGILEQILAKGYSGDFWDLLSKSDPYLASNFATAHRHNINQKEIKNLEQLLVLERSRDIVETIREYDSLKQYIAGQPEKIFQNWIEKNLWIFGVEYVKKYDAKKIALFSEGDLLMESMDGFLDLIELKRPKYEIFQYDSSHKSYYSSPDLSKTIGQCLLYLQKMDEYKSILEKEYKVKILRPRIKIIAGRTNAFNDVQFEALRMLNANLNYIQIISYDYLLSCGRKIISLYEK
ncbi:MAG: Shedu anti-phage system protein SduA domain-containing protein [Candidatus Peregrinibacteria bacterium]